jgi:hypothetical protein
VQDFSKLVRLFLVFCGPSKTIQMRSGSFMIEEAPIDSILPYLAWQSLVCSRVLLGVKGVEGDFSAERKSLNVVSKGDFRMIDANATLHGLSWVLQGIGSSKSLVFIEDEISSLLLRHEGILPVQGLVSEHLIGSYKANMKDWKLERATPSVESTNRLEMKI